MSKRIKEVEQATLRTFQEELPSIYFSDKTDAEFEEYAANAAFTYRDLFKFPPKMFEGASLIDFGAGTGENTVSLAKWGANCTLVEMNEKALAVARKVFQRYATRGEHAFILSSVFDFESPRQYDIVHCRGVLSHTADKEGAFRRIASFLKPGGFLIFGDPNKSGGFQNMLQRHAVYRFARTWDDMERVCEYLFKEDIDRSRSFIGRSRRAIIFDRWVIQSQDDPSVEEVMTWLDSVGLRLYSSYPPFVVPIIGDSAHHRPKFDAARTRGMAAIAETVWMVQKEGDRENVQALDADHQQYADALAAMVGYVANTNLGSIFDAARFSALVDSTAGSLERLAILHSLKGRVAEFLAEVKGFVSVVESGSLEDVRAYIESCRHLFKGAVGVRHVDFIAYKV